jgi:hypothetical protein
MKADSKKMQPIDWKLNAYSTEFITTSSRLEALIKSPSSTTQEITNQFGD